MREKEGTKTCFRGAEALEQRPESVPTQTCNLTKQTSNMTKEEVTQMKETKDTDAPKWAATPSNVFLAALHVLVLAISLVVHPPLESGAARALP